MARVVWRAFLGPIVKEYCIVGGGEFLVIFMKNHLVWLAQIPTGFRIYI